jgi:hypothetical protein
MDSPAFRKFFDGSSVVDEHGAPLIVYHNGSFDPAEDPVPSIGPAGMHWGTLEAAESRVAGKVVDDFISELKVDLDPHTARWHWQSGSVESFSYEEEGFKTEAQARGDAENYITTEVYEVAPPEEFPPTTAAWLRITNPKRVPDQGRDWTHAIKQAKTEGHDGLVYLNLFEDSGSDSYVVFHPNQIKSVDNAGTFDTGNPNVLGGVRRRGRRIW